MSHIFPSVLRSLLFLALATGAQAAPFVAPAEENPPFRRDLLPIDTDSMATLSEDLAVLSHGFPLETAAQRRAAAQSLALALALDPANSGARDTISELVDGKLPKTTKPARLTEAKARLWQIHAWLSTPEAGADGKLLGDMVGDTTSVLDPDNPVATALRESPEQGKWDDWVAPLSAFEEAVVVKNTTDPFVDIQPDMPDTPEKPATGSPAIVLTAGSVNSVLHVYDETFGSWDLLPTSVEMKATKEGSGKFEIAVSGALAEQEEIEQNVSNPIRAALEANPAGLPVDGLVAITVNGGGTYSAEMNGSAITGPAFILANSAITGVEPQATVLARLDDNNRFVAPNFFWRHIHALNQGKGGRLVVPAGTGEYFTAMLALEQPEFLLKYEVLVASSPEEFMALCAKAPSEKHARVFASFQEIRAKAQDNVLGTYLTNRFVRQRLQEIVDAAPYHLSAKLLAQQGAGERPRTITRKILAAEIWRAVNPVTALSKLELRTLEPEAIGKIEKIYDTMRVDLDRLDRYTDIRDRALASEGKDLATSVRTLTRALKSRSDDLYERYEAISSAHAAMVSANTAILEKLSQLSGDPLPEERPRRPRRRALLDNQ